MYTHACTHARTHAITRTHTHTHTHTHTLHNDVTQCMHHMTSYELSIGWHPPMWPQHTLSTNHPEARASHMVLLVVLAASRLSYGLSLTSLTRRMMSKVTWWLSQQQPPPSLVDPDSVSSDSESCSIPYSVILIGYVSHISWMVRLKHWISKDELRVRRYGSREAGRQSVAESKLKWCSYYDSGT